MFLHQTIRVYLLFLAGVTRSSSFSRVACYYSCPSSRSLSLISKLFTDPSTTSCSRLFYPITPVCRFYATPLMSGRLTPAIESARRRRWNCQPLLASNTDAEIYNDEYLQGLSSAQREIVTADLASIRVQAGPGSGKTR